MNLIVEQAFIMVIMMCISGFVFNIIFLPTEKYIGKLISKKAMVNVYTAAILSFVIPMYLPISLKDNTIKVLTSGELIIFQDIGGYNSFVCQVREHFSMEYIGWIWLIGVLMTLFYYLQKYRKLINTIKKHTFSISDDFWSVKFSEIKQEKHISNVSLVGSCNISTPCTVGIRKKYIVIPSYMINSFDEEEIKFILEHEFCHIRNDDLLRNLLILVLSCLNWFNPLYYLLRRNFLEWVEIACDEDVTKNYSKDQKYQYCKLIIKVLSLEEKQNEGKNFIVSFKGIKNYQRRISEVMKGSKKTGKVGKILVSIFVCGLLFCGTAVAKESDMYVHKLFSKNIHITNSEDGTIIESDHIEEEKMGEYEEIYYTDDKGITCSIIYKEKIPNINEKLENPLDPKHVHEYTDIIYKEHKKNTDGSCITKYYEGKKCISCGDVRKESLIRTVKDAKCTH